MTNPTRALLILTSISLAGAASAETVVADRDTLDLRASAGATELADGATWTRIDETLVAEVSCDAVREIALRFHPPAGREQRVRFRLDGDELAPFGKWTTGVVEIVLPVPAEGEDTFDAYEIETRSAAGTTRPLITGGYIRVKKLNSGG